MPTEGIAEGLVGEVLYSYLPAMVDNAVGEVLYAFDPPNLHNVLMEVLTSSAVFAVAGADQTTNPSTQVTLNASASVGATGYAWELTAVPAGSGLSTGSLGTTVSVNFTPDVFGTYSARLTATSATETDVDLISIEAVAPSKAQVNFATLVHGIVNAAQIQVNFATLVHGPPPIMPAQAEVNFATLVHGIVNAAQIRVNFSTLVHGGESLSLARTRFSGRIGSGEALAGEALSGDFDPLSRLDGDN